MNIEIVYLFLMIFFIGYISRSSLKKEEKEDYPIKDDTFKEIDYFNERNAYLYLTELLNKIEKEYSCLIKVENTLNSEYKNENYIHNILYRKEELSKVISIYLNHSFSNEFEEHEKKEFIKKNLITKILDIEKNYKIPASVIFNYHVILESYNFKENYFPVQLELDTHNFFKNYLNSSYSYFRMESSYKTDIEVIRPDMYTFGNEDTAFYSENHTFNPFLSTCSFKGIDFYEALDIKKKIEFSTKEEAKEWKNSLSSNTLSKGEIKIYFSVHKTYHQTQEEVPKTYNEHGMDQGGYLQTKFHENILLKVSKYSINR